MAEAYGSWATIQNRRRVRAYLATSQSQSNTQVTVSISAHCNCDLIAEYGVRCVIGVDGGGWNSGATGVCASGANVAGTTRSYTFNRGTSQATANVYGQVYGETVSGYGAFSGGTSQAQITVTIPALPSYSVNYNANGGSGAPGGQTKWYGRSLTLSSTVPTRTGYTFQGWATSSTGSVAYKAGGTYTGNSALTLYAVWSELTYTVSFDANGGTGAPAAQTKQYTQSLILSSTAPTRDLYDFLGWATQASATTAEYQAGGTFTANADTVLYAVWQLAWQAPVIDNVSVYRCDSSGAASDTGTYARVSYTWSTFNDLYPATSVTATCGGTTASGTASGTSGTFAQLFGGLDVETAYTVTMSVSDSQGTTTRLATVQPMSFIMDFSPTGGVGIDCIAPESGLKVDGAATVTGALTDGSNTYLPWQRMYPIGCIYLSYESTSPAQLFGGSWTQLTGVFLRAANDTATGGADSMTIYGSNLGIGTVAWMKKKIGEGTGQYGFGSGSAFYRQPVIASQAFTSLPEHEGINADVYGDPVNNMPAYQDIYAWRRTA